MTRASATETTAVSVSFSAAEKRMLERRARAAGQTLDEYIRERVIAESGCEEQVFGFLVDELVEVGERTRQAIAVQDAASSDEPGGSREARRARIAKEIRQSLTQRELDALTSLFKSARDARLEPAPGTGARLNEPKE